MNWGNIFTQKRLGTDTQVEDGRSEYQRDFDRLIFNSGFRRMQNKTQVFPLPGVTFVHNRLTHSLEVASVGRSLGKIVGNKIVEKYRKSFNNKDTIEFYKHELLNVIAAACLAHDVGNPPFGHSGEKAISQFFKDYKEPIEGLDGTKKLKDILGEKIWNEFTNFEGNANGLRYLTHSFNGKTPGGVRLTYTTLASTLKYPCSFEGMDNKTSDKFKYEKLRIKHRKKFNYFLSEKSVFETICRETNMMLDKSMPHNLLVYKRHPFAYLTEAADDICYKLIDIEDAQRLKIIDTDTVITLLMDLIKCLRVHEYNKVEHSSSKITDANDKVSYLRAKCVNALTIKCADRFIEKSEEIINGNYNNDLISVASEYCNVIEDITKITKEKIYNHPKVVKIEVLGYEILYDLLSLFIPAVLKKYPTHKDEKLRQILPEQFRSESMFDINNNEYDRVFSVLDFFSGMTDGYALRLYRELKGVDINSHD